MKRVRKYFIIREADLRTYVSHWKKIDEVLETSKNRIPGTLVKNREFSLYDNDYLIQFAWEEYEYEKAPAMADDPSHAAPV